MTEKLRFECIHCNAEGTVEISEDPMEFYKIRYCPCCGEELEIEEKKLRLENNNAKEDQQRYMVWFSAVSVTVYIGVLMTDLVSLERLDHLSSIGNTWVLSNMGIIGAFIASNVFIKNGNGK